MQPCCTTDEGWPLGAGRQGRLQTTLSCPGKEPGWGASRETARRDRVRCGSERRTLVNHRERVESVGTMSKPGRVVDPGPVQGESAARLDDIRHRGGVTLNQAVVRNVGTCRLDVKRDVQGRNPEDQRIETRHRDGATRSSEELGERPRERRGRVIRRDAPVNRASGRNR